MGSIMRYLKKVNALYAALFVISLLPLTATAEFRVMQLTPVIKDQSLLLNGELDLGLSEKTEEALSKGIPLEVIIELQLYRKRPIVWDQLVQEWEFRHKIRYHALSGQYLVKDHVKEPDKTESFTSLQQALAYMGTLEDLELAVKQELPESGAEFKVLLRASLAIEPLPVALRPVAYTSPSWHLNSGWTTWKVQH